MRLVRYITKSSEFVVILDEAEGYKLTNENMSQKHSSQIEASSSTVIHSETKFTNQMRHFTEIKQRDVQIYSFKL
jgi:hypothetical protein